LGHQAILFGERERERRIDREREREREREGERKEKERGRERDTHSYPTSNCVLLDWLWNFVDIGRLIGVLRKERNGNRNLHANPVFSFSCGSSVSVCDSKTQFEGTHTQL
jgi:hypothetical protein